MGVTVDLIPLAPDETPEQAIERIYEGGVAICWDGDDETMTLEPIEGALPEVAPLTDEAIEEWRTETLARLLALHPWQRQDFDGNPHLWSPNYRWQVEFETDHLTLRARYPCPPDPTLPELDDETFLATFEGLSMILHWPDSYGTWFDLDDPAGRPDTVS